MGNGKDYPQKVIVAYGGEFCYIDADDPYDMSDREIEKQGRGSLKDQSIALSGHSVQR